MRVRDVEQIFQVINSRDGLICLLQFIEFINNNSYRTPSPQPVLLKVLLKRSNQLRMTSLALRPGGLPPPLQGHALPCYSGRRCALVAT